jgi:hypothetical protein
MHYVKTVLGFILFISILPFLILNAKESSNAKPRMDWEMEIHMCKGSGSDNWGSSVSLDLYRVIATGSGDDNFVLEHVASGSVADGTVAHIEMRNTASNEWGDNVFDKRLGADGTNSYVIVFNGSHFLYFTTGTVDDWFFDYRYSNGVYSITQTGGGRDSDVLNSSIVWDPVI